MEDGNLRFARRSYIGRRQRNEDGVIVCCLPGGRYLTAIADGMGGQSNGRYASRRALVTLARAWKAGVELSECVRLVNETLYREAVSDFRKTGMGTTLVAAIIDGNSYRIVNVGDSRAYRITATSIERLTVDHSFVFEAVANGDMTSAEALASPWSEALTRSIGTDPKVEADHFGSLSLGDDEAVLLCTDGIHKVLGDREIESYFRMSGSTDDAAQILIAAAFRVGSQDNLSAVIVEKGRVRRQPSGATIPCLPVERTNGGTLPGKRRRRARDAWPVGFRSGWRGALSSQLIIPVLLGVLGIAFILASVVINRANG